MGLPSVCVWPCFPLLWQSLNFILSKLQQKGRGKKRRESISGGTFCYSFYHSLCPARSRQQQQPLWQVCFPELSTQTPFDRIRSPEREAGTSSPRNVPVVQLSLCIPAQLWWRRVSHRALASQIKGLGVQWPGAAGGRVAPCSLWAKGLS